MHADPNVLRLALGSNYDVEGSKLTGVDAELDWRPGSKWRLQAVSSFSGYRHEFEALNVRLTRDLHCWLATLTYNRDLGEIQLNLGIKAFPFEESLWSLGGSGQRLGSYSQVYY